jgi:hypothetical protein
MFDNMKPSASGRRCIMSDAMKRFILDRMDPSCLTSRSPPFLMERRCCMFENMTTLRLRQEVLHA